MSAQHEECAALIREYGRDAEGVERAMIEAGHGAVTAKASADMWADQLERWGFDVGGDASDEPTVEELAYALDATGYARGFDIEMPKADELKPADWDMVAVDEFDDAFDPADYDTKGAACAAFAAFNPEATPTEVADAVGCSYATARKHMQETN